MDAKSKYICWPEWLRKRSRSQRPPSETSTEYNDQGVYLTQVYPTEAYVDTDMDIIAIHGLDTKSPETWTWRNKDGSSVNWLADKHMLPSVAKRARIFTCDWPSSLWQPSDTNQRTLEELAILLFQGIKSRPPVANEKLEDRPILFIASCLGGIILMQALVHVQEAYTSIRKATRGVLFLATPFYRNALGMVAYWTRLTLGSKAAAQHWQAINLLKTLEDPAFDLVSLVRNFTALYTHDAYFQLFNFYEKKPMSLPRRSTPWLPKALAKESFLMDSRSATLQIVSDPLPLMRDHASINKFSGPNCIDYKLVSGKIREMVQDICKGTSIQQADAWIWDNCYAEYRLAIKRVSGQRVSLEQYYIDANLVKEAEPDVLSDSSSSYSDTICSADVRLADRTLDLSTLFDPKKDPNGCVSMARRIWVQGSPGAGKTTLCAKIVHDFRHGLWSDHFDRILWVPLSRLMTWRPCPTCHYAQTATLGRLFQSIFFFGTNQSEAWASELWQSLERNDGNVGERTLFLLDELDEVFSSLSGSWDLSRLIECLLNQRNVLVMSRPSGRPATIAPGICPFDVELELASFAPCQVQTYISRVGLPGEAIQSFLKENPLVQDIIQIPLCLDAFCQIWQDFTDKNSAVTPSLVDVFQATEVILWKQYHMRLGIEDALYPMTSSRDIRRDLEYIEMFAVNEVTLLQALAFTGLCHDLVEFGGRLYNEYDSRLYIDVPAHDPREVILPVTVMPHISFLQSTDTKAEVYRFVHPVFQDYMAARYFVQQWKAGKPLMVIAECPPTTSSPEVFAQTNEKNARFSTFWHFVRALLEDETAFHRLFEPATEQLKQDKTVSTTIPHLSQDSPQSSTFDWDFNANNIPSKEYSAWLPQE